MYDYKTMYDESIKNKDHFMSEQAYDLLDWFAPFVAYEDENGNFFNGGIINACYNAVDRHLIGNSEVSEGCGSIKIGVNNLETQNTIKATRKRSYKGNKPAIIFVDDDMRLKKITYDNLFILINKISTFIMSLKTRPKCVTLYAPATIEVYAGVLACSRLAIPVNYVFGGFSDVSLSSRIISSNSSLVITVDKAARNDKQINYYENVLNAIRLTDSHVDVLLFDTKTCESDSYEYDFSTYVPRTFNSLDKNDDILKGNDLEMSCRSVSFNLNQKADNYFKSRNQIPKFEENSFLKNNLKPIFSTNAYTSYDIRKERKGRVYFWQDVTNHSYEIIKCVGVPSNYHMIYLFTSGSTGAPKCIAHNTGGYLFGTALNTKYVFNFTSADIHYSTADIGWLAGISHSLFGPLIAGGTTVISTNTPFYPLPLKIFSVLANTKATHFYTAPTVFRLLKKICNDNNVTKDDIERLYDISKLDIIGSVGEVLDESTADFISGIFGYQKSIVNTYWQTETGSILLSPVVLSKNSKCYGVGVPTFGIEPVIASYESTRENVLPCAPGEKGLLLFKGYWPALLQDILGDSKARFRLYLSVFTGYFFTGDEAVCDAHGNYHILGRTDDVINMCGHRVSTSEIESVVMKCGVVAEAAAVSAEDEMAGHKVIVYVVIVEGSSKEDVRDFIKSFLRKNIGPIIRHVDIFIVKELPKTRSGKIMRRLLKKGNKMGDLTGCVNPETLCEIFNK